MTSPSWSKIATRFRTELTTNPRFGGWLEVGTPTLVDALAGAGAHWVGIDLQHGLETRTRLVECIRAAERWGLPTLVRVPSARPDHIAEALDAGACGIIVPLVENEKTATQIVRASRFAPAGQRSWGPLRILAQESSLTPSTINDAILVFVMIESRAGYENREAILSTDGVDGVFVGPADLSISATELEPTWPLHETVEQMVQDIRITAERHGVIPGYSCPGGSIAAIRAEQGFRMMPVSSDFGLVKGGWSAQHEIARGRSAVTASTVGGQYGT